LAIFPIVLDFHCATSALTYLPASKVQVIELSEPLFAMFFVRLIVYESATMRFWFGHIWHCDHQKWILKYHIELFLIPTVSQLPLLTLLGRVII